ncbi:hypothetical protein [Arenicella xantha]|uniref:Secreted protein n=1 Tax=Arenicella xantha TaxID=644221 RepID=A0A395JHB3_9GAMM|nr:hypothetical protein [Arenicella xantha]RBP49347.1 hypothetical protein DFR28_104278 [Arenicella xantha]
MNLFRICIVFALAWSLLACSSASSDEAFEVESVGTELPPTIEVVHQEMEAIAENRYCDVDSDCATMPIGQRACGGPSAHMVYSKQIGTQAIVALENLAKQSAELAQQTNQRNQMMSTCQMLPPAVAACIEQRCVITSPSNLLESGTPDPNLK